jgi:hypothetical protein
MWNPLPVTYLWKNNILTYNPPDWSGICEYKILFIEDVMNLMQPSEPKAGKNKKADGYDSSKKKKADGWI